MIRRLRLLAAWLRELRHLRWLEHGRAWGSDGEVPVSLWPSVPVDEAMRPWQELAWEARFDEVRDAPDDDIEDAFRSMTTGWFTDDRRWMDGT